MRGWHDTFVTVLSSLGRLHHHISSAASLLKHCPSPRIERLSYLQLSVVFILPRFTSKHTIAIFKAFGLSDNILSLSTLLVFELLAIASIYTSANVCPFLPS